MTASTLLHGMLQNMAGVSMSAFRTFYAGDDTLRPFVTKHEDRLPVILQEIGEDAFWKYGTTHDWLMPLLPENGDRRLISWTEFLVCLPQAYDAPLSDETFIDALKLYVWLTHAARYSHFEIDASAPMKKSRSRAAATASGPPPKMRTPKGKASPSKSRFSRRYKDEDRSIDTYLVEIGATPLIDPAEEARLSIRIKQGDDQALQKMTKANLRFVVSIAKQYQNQGLSLADLINEGNIGLIKAAKRFDHTRGFKFISYAVWWIRQAILQALAEQSRIVRLPLNRVGTLHKIGKTASSLEQELGREPTPDEIASELELSESEVHDTMSISNTHLSLDAPFSTEEDNSLIDVLEDESIPPPDEVIFKELLRQAVDEAVDSLTPKEAEVIELYFGLREEKALTLDEIGIRFNLTRERVRQIREKAMRRLRHPSRIRILVERAMRSGHTPRPDIHSVPRETYSVIREVVQDYQSREI